jgi:hypothetical protein
MSPFSLLGLLFPLGSFRFKGSMHKFYDLSLQAMVLSTVYISLNFQKSSTLSDNWMIADCILNPPGQLIHDTLS